MILLVLLIFCMCVVQVIMMLLLRMLFAVSDVITFIVFHPYFLRALTKS